MSFESPYKLLLILNYNVNQHVNIKQATMNQPSKHGQSSDRSSGKMPRQ